MPAGSQRASQLDAKLKNVKSRGLRSQLRHLTETIRNDGEDLADHTKNLLSERVRELDSLSKQVERPSEQADDSEAFYTLAQRGAEMAKRISAGKGRTANDFIRHLKALFVAGWDAQEDGAIHPTAFNWRRLGRVVQRYFHYAPGVSCMLGPMEAVPKERKQAQRVQRKPVGRAVAPQVLAAEDAEAQEKRETERNMETMWNVLKTQADGIGLLELTMNSQSFAQFAENMFTLSFLVHNKRARISESGSDNARGLLVFPHNDRVAQREGKPLAQDKDRSQFVLPYTMADWTNWKLHVRPESCLMPHRAAHDYAAEMVAPRGTEAEEAESEEEGEPQPSRTARRSQERSGGRKHSRKELTEEESEVADGSEDEVLVKPKSQQRKRLRKSGQM